MGDISKIIRLTKGLEVIEEKKETLKKKYEQRIEYLDNQYKQSCLEITKEYNDFFKQKQNKEFVLYNRFPPMDALNVYLKKFFPLYYDGLLNVKELAEVIKHLYQFNSGKDYTILTIGATESSPTSSYVKPHLNILIGNEKTLAPYQELNGIYSNNNEVYSKICSQNDKKDFINIEVDDCDCNGEDRLDIECFYEEASNQETDINHYNFSGGEHSYFTPSLKKTIFASQEKLKTKLQQPKPKRKGIKDVFDFDIHSFDSYIANVLISVVIYKRNNHLQDLSSNDYNHIFDVLYNESVDIIGDAEKDIPKQLRYVPNKKSGR